MTTPDLTILIGPSTRLALAVNASIRGRHAALGERGVTALPHRLASPLVRTVAVGEEPERLRFLQQPCAHGLDLRDVRRDDLDGEVLVQHRVAGAVDDAHRAAPEHGLEAVRAGEHATDAVFGGRAVAHVSAARSRFRARAWSLRAASADGRSMRRATSS